jgi:hypothetical protein
MKDYTAYDDIVRGGRWPAAGDALTVQITNDSGWPAGADGWLWELLLSRTLRGGTPDLALAADSVSVADDVLTLTFHAAPDETLSLPGSGRQQFYVEVRSTEGGGTTTTGSGEPPVVSYYDCVQGTAVVRNPAGE